MFKKKTIYIILLIVFTLILCADIAIYVFVPGTSGRGSVPENFDPENMPDLDASADESYAGDAAAPGDFSGSLPSDVQTPDMSGTAFAQGGTRNGFSSFVKSAFIPILIACVLIDGFCVFMLIWLSKKHKEDEAHEKKDDKADKKDNDEPPKKRKKRLWIIAVVLVMAAAAVIAALPGKSSGTGGSISVESSVINGTAQTGDIVSSFYGSGTLADAEAEEVTVLDSVKIVSYVVKNGDVVSEGDAIAKIDRVSAETAIAGVQEAIDAVDAEIEEAGSDSISSAVESPSSGRVKAVYAEEDKSVSDTMNEYGALMLISLDGCMAVKADSDAECTVGQTVTVVLSDGTEEAGKVIETDGNTVTVTLTDDGPAYGDTVSIKDGSGSDIGSGELYIHNELKITGFTGTVSDVKVSEEDSVSKGKKLLTLSDTEYTGEYQSLLKERRELAEEMEKLAVMYHDGYVYAECGGIVSGISDDAEYSGSAAEKEEAESSAAQLGSDSAASSGSAAISSVSASASGTSGITLLGTSAASSGKGGITLPGASAASSGKSGIVLLSDTQEETGSTGTGESTGGDAGGSTGDGTGTGTGESTGGDAGGSTGTGGSTGGDASGGTGGSGQRPAFPGTPPSGGFPGGGRPDSGNGSEPTASGKYAGTVSSVSYGALNIMRTAEPAGDLDQAALAGYDTSVFTVQSEYSPELSLSAYTYDESGALTSGSISAISAGDMVLITLDEKGELTEIVYISSGGKVSMSGGFGGGFSQSAAAETVTAERYTISEQTVCSVTPNDAMSVSISADELDVLSLAEGQSAVITLDAVSGQSFDGEITSIDPMGTNEGGSTKYTVTLKLARSESMLGGMNISVQIATGSTENAVVIPASALNENGNEVFVYTGYDEKSDTLTSPVSVVTGASDGENVQISEGLKAGDSIFYRYADSLVYSAG